MSFGYLSRIIVHKCRTTPCDWQSSVRAYIESTFFDVVSPRLLKCMAINRPVWKKPLACNPCLHEGMCLSHIREEVHFVLREDQVLRTKYIKFDEILFPISRDSVGKDQVDVDEGSILEKDSHSGVTTTPSPFYGDDIIDLDVDKEVDVNNDVDKHVDVKDDSNDENRIRPTEFCTVSTVDPWRI